MKFFNKNLLITIIGLVTFFNTYTITTEAMIDAVEKLIASSSTSTSSSNSSINTFDTTPYNFTHATPTESMTFQTVRHEDKIMLEADYSNKKTGEIAHIQAQLYPDNSLINQNCLQLDSQSLSSTIANMPNDISNSSSIQRECDYLNDHSNDFAIEARRQEIEENQMVQMQNATEKLIRFICEKDLRIDQIYFRWNFGGVPLDSDLLLKNKNIFHDPRVILSSLIIKARFERIDRYYTYKIGLGKNFRAERNFTQALESGHVLHLLNQIYDSNLPIAQAAFNELKKLWIRDRKNMFLVHNSYNKRELAFITELGIDIMSIAERALITRPDYITQHVNEQSLKTIQEYKNYCTQLQQRGNRSTLRDEIKKLRSTVTKKSDFATKISLAVGKKIFFDPVTTVLDEIAHVPSLKKACDHVKSLELQLLIQANQHGIVSMNEVRTWITNYYGFDVLDAAQNCYKARTDYVYTLDNQSYLSDTMKPILRNIESKKLPAAHAELVHLEKQLTDGFKDQNITNPSAQKEYMAKYFGTNVLEAALQKYKTRSDHKELVQSFIPLDVEKATITILENNNTYESVANKMNDLANCVFVNARLCKLDFVENIENHIIDSLHVIKAPQNDAQFIFNVTVVDHLLTDIQQVSQGIVTGKPTLWERSPELFMRGLEKFFKGLNPITQVTSLCHLLKDTAIAGYYILDDTLDVALHPNPMDQKNFFLKGQVCESLVNAARFTTDLIFGSSYLSTEEYLQRHAIFWKDYGSTITADNVVDLTAQILADFAYCKGIPSLLTFLKKIDAATKMEKQIAKVAETFKKAVDTRFAKNPILVTVEGIPVQISTSKIIEYMEATNANTKNVVSKVEKIVENTGTTAKMRGKQGSPYQKISKSTNTRPLDRLKGKDLIGIEDVSVSGYESLPKRVFLNNYEHYLQPELRTTTSGKIKPSGWHHDPGKNIERIKRVNGHKIEIEKYKKHSSGIYKFRWGVEGMEKKPSTFFPHTWSRETVQQKIVEAYKYARKNHCIPQVQPKGNFSIEGFTKEGIEVKIIIDQKGTIVTAYPVWPE